MHILGFFLFLLVFCISALANPPAYFALPGNAVIGGLFEEEYGEAEIPLPNRDTPHLLRGRHWSGDMHLRDHGFKPGVAAREVFARLKPTLLKAGWQVVHEFDHGATLRMRKEGKDAWVYLGTADPDDMRWVIIEMADQARKHVLAKPAPKPESFTAKDPIPYLMPLPEFKSAGGGYNAEPLYAVIDKSGEVQALGQGIHHRMYGGPEQQISPLQFTTIFETALKAAGWQIVQLERGGVGAQRGEVLARYTRDGRDIWARVSGGGDNFQFEVADAGADDLASRLRKDCRAALSGVFFDFNKSTLKPESEATLSRVRQALLANAAVAYEIQGHTDNVGNDAYNQKLSEARAGAVVSWLTSKGVPATGLNARGYGRLQPVASNDTDEGRSRNRRVEVACRK